MSNIFWFEAERSYNPAQPRDDHGRWSSGFPSEYDLYEADLHQFGDSLHRTYTTNINGKHYFVKQVSAQDSIRNEVAGYQAAKAFGIGDHVIPVQAVGENTVVSPWVDGRQFAELSQKEKINTIGSLSDEEFTMLHMHEYLMGDDDRHSGNYMVDKNGKLLLIDQEGIGTKDIKQYSLVYPGRSYEHLDDSPSLLPAYRAEAKDTLPEYLSLHDQTIERILDRGNDVLGTLQNNKVERWRIQGVFDRYNTLNDFSKQKSGKTLGDFFAFTRQSGNRMVWLSVEHLKILERYEDLQMIIEVGCGHEVYGTVENDGDTFVYSGPKAHAVESLIRSLHYDGQQDRSLWLASLPSRLRGRVWARVKE